MNALGRSGFLGHSIGLGGGKVHFAGEANLARVWLKGDIDAEILFALVVAPRRLEAARVRETFEVFRTTLYQYVEPGGTTWERCV